MLARRVVVGVSAAVMGLTGTLTLASSDVAGATASGVARTRSTASAPTKAVVRHRAARVSKSAAAQVAAITTAVHKSEFVADIPASDYKVTGVRVSGSWARATLTPKDVNQLDPATVVLKKDTKAWTVVDLGSYEVGCGVAPAKAVKALALECP